MKSQIIGNKLKTQTHCGQVMPEAAEDLLTLSDSVVMGDIHIGASGIAECPMCGIQGVPVFKCGHSDCNRRFCETCEKGWKIFGQPGTVPLCSVHHTQAEDKHQAENLQKHGITKLTGNHKVRTFRPINTNTRTNISTSKYSVENPQIISFAEPSEIWRWVGTISIAGLCLAVIATVWSWFGRGNL